MSLQVVAGDGDSGGDDGPRILAPGSPPSPGPVPNAYAAALRPGEALVWWDHKVRMSWGPMALVLGAMLLVLGAASAFAPEFWDQPWSGLWPPLLALLSPVLAMVLRERASLRAVLVTDDAIIGIGRRSVSRVPVAAIRAVRPDPLRGGLRVDGPRSTVRIPPTLSEDARRAVMSQRRGRVMTDVEIDDPLGWLR